MMTREDARELARNFGIPLGADFHALGSDVVESILSAANSRGYRKPRGANGSRARSFYAYLSRRAARGKLQTREATAPGAWASYFINGDSSGLEDGEIAAADAFLARLGWGAPCGCEDAGFLTWHDARAELPLAADCQTYSFLVES